MSRAGAAGPIFNRGRQLLEQRVAGGQTHEQLARRVGCSRSMISRLCGGHTPRYLDLALALERALGIPPRAWHEPPHREVANVTAETRDGAKLSA